MMGEKDGATEFTFTIPKENIKLTVDPEEQNNATWAIMRAGLINTMSVAAGMDSNIGKGDKATEIAMMTASLRAMKFIVDDTTSNARAAMMYGPIWESLDHRTYDQDGNRTDVPPYKRANDN